MTVDHSTMKLGRKALKTDSRTPRLARYLAAEIAPAPVACDWTKGIQAWGMMMNDTLGCCTISACGHAVQVWSANANSTEITVADSDILEAYEVWDGYVQGDSSTDNGGIELDVLRNWKANTFAGNALSLWADPNVKNVGEIRQAIALFGGLYIGVSLPLTAQTQQGTWDFVPDDGSGDSASGSWGGHAVFVCAYDADSLTCITWGELKKMTWAFWLEYVDEAHCLLSPVWIGAKGAPSGLDLDQLTADVAAIV
jgi:hypothetical protein